MNFKRLLIIQLVLLVLSAILHVLIYNTSGHWYMTKITISNALFVVGVISFLPALVAASGAYSLFFGIRYSLGIMLSPKYREKYPKYFDYISTKNVEIKSTVFNEVLIASAVILLAAILIGMVI